MDVSTSSPLHNKQPNFTNLKRTLEHSFKYAGNIIYHSTLIPIKQRAHVQMKMWYWLYSEIQMYSKGTALKLTGQTDILSPMHKANPS